MERMYENYANQFKLVFTGSTQGGDTKGAEGKKIWRGDHYQLWATPNNGWITFAVELDVRK
jgi:hypothetical protein